MAFHTAVCHSFNIGSRLNLFGRIFPFWNRVIAGCAPGMTFQNSFYSQPHTFQRPPLFNGFDSIRRAGWVVPAVLS